MGNLHSKLTSDSDDRGQEPPWFAFLDNWAVFAEDSTLPEYQQGPTSDISHNSPKSQQSVDVGGENIGGSKAKTSMDAGDFEEPAKCLEEQVGVKTIPESTSLGAENGELRTQLNTKSCPDSIVDTRDQPTNTISQFQGNGGNVQDFVAAQSARGDFNSKEEAKASDGTLTSTPETLNDKSGVEYKGEKTEIHMGQKLSQNKETNLEPNECDDNKKSLNCQDLRTESTEEYGGSGIQDGDVTVLIQKGPKVVHLSEVNEKQVNKDDQHHSLVEKITGVFKAPSVSFHLGYQGKEESRTKDHENYEEDEDEEDDVDDEDEDEDDEDDDEEEDDYDEEEVDVDGGDDEDESEKKGEKDKEEKNERRSENTGVENYFSVLANFVRKAVSQEDAGTKAITDLQGQKDDMEKSIKKSTPGNNESEGHAADELKRGQVEKVLEHKHNAYIESIHNYQRAKGEGQSPGMDPRDDTTKKVVEKRGILELENKVPVQKVVGKEGNRPQHGTASLMNLDSGGKSVKNGNKSTKTEQGNGSKFHFNSKETGVNRVIEDRRICHQNSCDDVSSLKRRDQDESRSKDDKHPASVNNGQIHNIDERRKNPQDKELSTQSNHAKSTAKDVIQRAWAWKQRTGFESRHPRKDKPHDEGNKRENGDGGMEKSQELFELFAGSLLTKKEDMAAISSKYRGYGEGLGDALSIDFGKGKLLFGWSGERIEANDYGLESLEGSQDFFSVGETFYDAKDSKSRVDTDIKDFLYTKYDDAGSEKCEGKEITSREKRGKQEQFANCFGTGGGYWVGEDPTSATAGRSYTASAVSKKSLGSPLPHDYIAKYNMKEADDRRKDLKGTSYFLGRKQKHEETDTKQQDQNGNFYLDQGISCKEVSGFYRSSADQQFYGSRDRDRSLGLQCTYFGDAKKHVEQIGQRETSGDITFGRGDDIYSCSKPPHSNGRTIFKRYYEHTGDMVEKSPSPSKKTYYDKFLERDNNSYITASKQSRSKYFEKYAPYHRPSKMRPCSYLFDNEVPDTPQDDDDAPLVPDLCFESFVSYNDFAVVESQCQTGEQECDGSCVQITPCDEEGGSFKEDRGFCGVDDVTQEESDAGLPSHENSLENESKNTNHNASSDWPVDIKMTNWSSKARETSNTVHVMPRDIEDCDPTSRIKEILGRLAGHSNSSLSILGKNVLAVLPWKKGHGVNLNFKPGTATETRIIQEFLNLFFMAESPFLCLTVAFMSLFLICKQQVTLETSVYGVEEATDVTNRMDLASSLTGSLRHQRIIIQQRGELAEGFSKKKSCDKRIDWHQCKHSDHIDTQVVRVVKFERNGVHFKIPGED